jgi:DHA2 family multidrug resistance protein
MSFTLPVFLQSNLRMTAQQAGIAMLPGAIATAISMAVVGRITNKFDARWLIALGALIFAYAAWELSRMTGQSGAGDFFWPLIWRGVGLGLMFVPLTTVTLAELTPQELPQGAGLYNFFRQLGGSFGIAVMATLLTRYATQMRAVLSDHVTMSDPGSLARLDVLKRAMIARGADAWTAQQRAYALLSRQLDAQASVISYSKIYMLSALLILALIPLLALVRVGKSKAGAHVIAE